MIGIMMLLVAGTYIAIWILVVRFSYRLTFRVTESKKKSFSIATAFFLIMYLIPFWDLIPTLIMHKYYCNTQAGLWIYKTPEEWISENPDSLDLGELKERERVKIEGSSDSWKKYHVNDRFVYEVNRSVSVFLSINLEEKIFRDKKVDKPLIRKVDFWIGSKRASIPSGGSLEGWRQLFVFEWLGRGKCEADGASDDFKVIENKFRMIGEK